MIRLEFEPESAGGKVQGLPAASSACMNSVQFPARQVQRSSLGVVLPLSVLPVGWQLLPAHSTTYKFCFML
jgi:hypothetical protein